MITDTETIEGTAIDLEPRPAQPLTVLQGGMQMRQQSVFERAIDTLMRRPDANLDQLQQMMAMHERWEEREAKKAFVAAMAQFKKNPPKIVKDKLVGYLNKDGSTTGYWHATLANVCDAAIKGLAEVGISHSWEVDQTTGQIAVTCVLTHDLGHSERVTISAPADTSGKKNAIQSINSTITYLERYTLLAATGLATEEQDDDGAGHADPYPAWAHEIVGTVNAAMDSTQLRAIRNAAAERCQKEQAVRVWNELLNPTIKDKAEKSGWVHTEKATA